MTDAEAASSAPRAESAAAPSCSTCWSIGQAGRAFALRIDGTPVAYLNRCVHVQAEMDWQPGEFLDHDRRFIVCSMHGATYEPAERPLRGRTLRARAPDATDPARRRGRGPLVSFR